MSLTKPTGNMLRPIVLGTPQNSTSGTAIDFTGIPAGVRRVTLLVDQVSSNGFTGLSLRIGTSSGFEASGYRTAAAWSDGGGSGANATTHFLLSPGNNPANTYNGVGVLELVNSSTNLWAFSSQLYYDSGGFVALGAGTKALSGALERVRFFWSNGTDTFDAGTLNISYEF